MKRTRLLIAVLGLFLLVQAAQAVWTPNKRLTWTSGESIFPAIAVDYLGHLHVVWADGTRGNLEIYYKKSTDGGASWAPNQRLTWTSGQSVAPAIAVDDSGHLHVAWYDYTPGDPEIYYKRSTDGGAAWTASRRLTFTEYYSYFPAIAADSSGGLHLVWNREASGNWEVYYKKSTDGGASWGTSQRLTWNAGDSEHPTIAVDSSGHLHVVWYDFAPGNNEIYYKKSTNGGASWTAGKRLTSSSNDSNYPAIAVDSTDGLHVVWSEYASSNFDVYYKKSVYGGVSWTTSQRVTWNSGNSLESGIAFDSSGNLQVVWQDDSPGNCEIYHKKSIDNGASWTATQRLTWTTGDSKFPAIAVDSSGNLHVVWWDDTPGNSEIYYKTYQ